jgi:hypothetical protein
VLKEKERRRGKKFRMQRNGNGERGREGGRKRKMAH